MPNNPEFTHPPDCKYADECALLGRCYEAVIINTEIGYRKKGMISGALEYQTSSSTCTHKQAVQARAEAQELIKK